ncbi:unnamed protein product (macronuclear) [Paramecium tetraurelia]|uniref:Uncharacterized protein n=1 Tax=Paramecium tetraurelia TaxID=5888 RepID=A0BHP0_PARTE|nr:uncharacterized protein GSPATT00029093001 [Paramecium tetraurelia]CAK58057.1 unnamed protein product [Paramecium tetraurelia]|eukprot:XP_001425455.1 hypothetical protein (macronuclear) [Paramecium tetraurelia strain d4-2]
MRRKSCHCNHCGSLTTLQYRNMSVPFIKKVSRLRKQPSMNNSRLLTAQNTKKLFRKYSASRQDTVAYPSSSQLLLTTLRRASARSTEKLIEDTQIRIFEPPKSCRSHLLSNPQSEEIKSITLQIPKSQRIIKTQPQDNHNIKLLHTRSMPRIYTRNFLNNYLTKYKKKKTILHLQKN